MRCDLHVHTRYSGPVDLPGLRHVSRECYSEPLEVYRTAKRRGMDLVTITDHDTIEGAVQLAHLPDFIIGEEVTCEMAPRSGDSSGHVGPERKETRRGLARRRDPEALFAWLAGTGFRRASIIPSPRSPAVGKPSTSIERFETSP